MDMVSGKTLSKRVLQSRLVMVDPKFGNEEVFSEFCINLQSMPLTYLEAKSLRKGSTQARPSKKSLLDEAYARVRVKLPLYFYIVDGTYIYYYHDKRGEAHACYKDDLDGFELAIITFEELTHVMKSEYVAEQNAELRATLTLEDFVKNMHGRFKYDTEKRLHSEPATLSWDSSKIAYKQLDPAMLTDTPTPTWNQFTSRLDYPEHFKAFVWSVFEPRNKGRQALYLYGAGFDGKSSAFSAVASLLGDKHTMSIDNQKLKDTQFFYGNVHGRRLVLYPDCKVTSVLRHEVIKSLLGRDKVQVNRKHKDAFSAGLDAKLMIASNRFPRIDPDDKSERTRLMFLKVSPIKDNLGDYTFEANLRREMGAFLYQCRSAYELLCPTHAEFRLPQGMIDNITNECMASDASAIQDFIEDQLEFSENFSVPKQDLDNAAKERAINSKQDSFSVIDNLQVKLFSKGVTLKRKSEHGRKQTYYVGVRLNNLK